MTVSIFTSATVAVLKLMKKKILCRLTNLFALFSLRVSKPTEIREWGIWQLAEWRVFLKGKNFRAAFNLHLHT